jgi:hypothetical protein
MTNTANIEYRNEPQGRSFAEHLVFLALLLPTFVVLAAAVVSLARPDPSIAGDRPAVTVAACEPCPGQDADDGP